MVTMLRAILSRVKSMPAVRRHYHPLLRAGIAFVGGRPVLRRTARLAGRLVPGGRRYIRRVLAPVPPVAAIVAAPDRVTVEELRALSRRL